LVLELTPNQPTPCCFVLLTRYWGIVKVPGSFLFRGPGVAGSSPFTLTTSLVTPVTLSSCSNRPSATVLLCSSKPIFGNRYGPRASSCQRNFVTVPGLPCVNGTSSCQRKEHGVARVSYCVLLYRYCGIVTVPGVIVTLKK